MKQTMNEGVHVTKLNPLYNSILDTMVIFVQFVHIYVCQEKLISFSNNVFHYTKFQSISKDIPSSKISWYNEIAILESNSDYIFFFLT